MIPTRKDDNTFTVVSIVASPEGKETTVRVTWDCVMPEDVAATVLEAIAMRVREGFYRQEALATDSETEVVNRLQ